MDNENNSTELVGIKTKADFINYFSMDELEDEWAEIIQDELPEYAEFQKMVRYENPKTKNATLIVYFQLESQIETDMYTIFSEPSQEKGLGLKIECKTEYPDSETICKEVYFPEKGRIICDCGSSDSYMNIKRIPELEHQDYPWNTFSKEL